MEQLDIRNHNLVCWMRLALWIVIVKALRPVLPTRFFVRECEPAVMVGLIGLVGSFSFLGLFGWLGCFGCFFGSFGCLSVWMFVCCVGV